MIFVIADDIESEIMGLQKKNIQSCLIDPSTITLSVSDWPGVLTTILATGLTWLAAQFSWRYLEKPLLNRGHSFKY